MISCKKIFCFWGALGWAILTCAMAACLYKFNSCNNLISSLVECMIISCLYLSMPRNSMLLRIMKLAIGLVLSFIIIIQMQLVASSGNFLTLLGLSNVEAMEGLGISIWQILPFIIATLWLCIDFFCGKRNKALRGMWGLLVIIFLLAGGVKIYNKFNSEKIESPVYSFFSLILHLKQAMQSYDAIQYDFLENKDKYLSEFRQNNFYTSRSRNIGNEKPNVIVIFVEGMSSRFIDNYGSKYKDLTPSMDEFYNKSLVFGDYYNHTAATFRGLRGQLISGYQFNDGYDSRGRGIAQISSESVVRQTGNAYVVTLPDILKKHGYDTSFIAANPKGSQMEAFLGALRFDEVFMSGDFVADNHVLSDKEFFDALWNHVNSKQSSGKPFFVSTYNFGTHAAMDSPHEKYRDADNIALNRFHNFDVFFGEFLKKVNSSPMKDNTIIILTSDHASYSGPEIMDADHDASPYFVDRVPLMINGANISHAVMDANGRNSLSLAPTLLDVMGINDGENYFIGCSLFVDKCPRIDNVSVVGESFFMTDKKGVYSENNIPDAYRNRFEEGKKQIRDNYRITSS